MNTKIIILIIVIGVGLFFLFQVVKKSYHENITSHLNLLHHRINQIDMRSQQMEAQVSKIVGTVGFHELFDKVENQGLCDILGNNNTNYDNRPEEKEEKEQEEENSDDEYQEESLEDTDLNEGILGRILNLGGMNPFVNQQEQVSIEIESDNEEKNPPNSPAQLEELEEFEDILGSEKELANPVSLAKSVETCQYIIKTGPRKDQNCRNKTLTDSNFCRRHNSS